MVMGKGFPVNIALVAVALLGSLTPVISANKARLLALSGCKMSP
jgi:hypothetical protein